MTTPRWYCLSAIGVATLCGDEADARREAADADAMWPRHAPHVATQLVPMAEIDRLRARVAELESNDGDCFTGMLVEIDGHAYGLRPGAARVVRDALRDAGRYRWLRHGDNDDEVIRGDTYGLAFLPRNAELDAAIDAAMAKGGAR